MPTSVVSVKQLNLYLKSLIEADSNLAYISVKGELSNVKVHFASGHIYFTLKDEDAAVKCVMFKGNALSLTFQPKDGMKVVCSGRVSVYERDGVYQIYAERMVQEGEGDLLANYERLKAKLEAEGLFDKSRKKPIPRFPQRVSVITSETGAAVRDIFNVLTRRYPMCDILLIPATVQGEAASKSLCSAIDIAETTNSDVVIIGRGGGSAEDLWCFNDEALARKIAAANIPIISAVGHETDFTLCDFVSDLRAPTPSAAAELAVPDINEISSDISGFKKIVKTRMKSKIETYEQGLSKILSSNIFAGFDERIMGKRYIMLDSIRERIESLVEKKLMSVRSDFSRTAATLEALSPIKTMLRGYSVAEKDEKIVKTVDSLQKNDKINLKFSDGSAECTVNSVRKDEI